MKCIIPGATAISVGYWHACAVLIEGSVYCWGSNEHGQLGQNWFENYAVEIIPPFVGKPFFPFNVLALCVLPSRGTPAKPPRTPVKGSVPLHPIRPVLIWLIRFSFSDAIAVAAGYMHTCAVVSPGDVCCWGYNEYGQLGTGDNLDRFFPIFLSGLWLGKIHRFALTCHAAAQNSFSFTRSLQSLSQST
jgi:alpha-tubulin suppressor-like RCC1 family protein